MIHRGRFTATLEYVNMPPFGLAKAGALHTAEGRRQSARSRLHMLDNDA